VNTSLNVIRSRQRNVLTRLDVDYLQDSVSWRRSSAEDEIREELQAVMAELSPRTAEIFILRHAHGYKDSEIAKLLGISRGTVAVTLFRARARLRKSIRAIAGEK
jgi:RNA polymerase sigma factor (sigma-70 family)